DKVRPGRHHGSAEGVIGAIDMIQNNDFIFIVETLICERFMVEAKCATISHQFSPPCVIQPTAFLYLDPALHSTCGAQAGAIPVYRGMRLRLPAKSRLASCPDALRNEKAMLSRIGAIRFKRSKSLRSSFLRFGRAKHSREQLGT